MTVRIIKIRRAGRPCQGQENGVGRNPAGVGTELHPLLSTFGFKPESGCKCTQHAAEMDERGIEWCEANQAEIVGWMTEEAERRKIIGRHLPGFRLGAYAALRIAIHRAKSKRDAAAAPASPDA